MSFTHFPSVAFAIFNDLLNKQKFQIVRYSVLYCLYGLVRLVASHNIQFESLFVFLSIFLNEPDAFS